MGLPMSITTSLMDAKEEPVVVTASLPDVVYVELADYCNLNCVFCGRENEIKTVRGGDVGGFADLEKIKMLERPLRTAKYLGLSGRIGEPLIYPHLAELLDWLYALNPSIKLRITTNGTALSQKMAGLLRDRIDFLAISLNASNADAYARDMRPVGYKPGTDWTPKWNNFIRRITEFIEALPPSDRSRVRIIAPIHRGNIEDVPDFVRLVSSTGCTHATLTPMQVHAESDIDLSIYWFKDKYNDVIDDVAASAAKAGVKVEAARFYSTVKTDLTIDKLCHEPVDVAYLNMGTQSKGAPCCHWTERFIPIDVYTDSGAFERFWNSDLYQRLRSKRDFASCKACGLARTFDEVMFHFTPMLKRKLIASQRIDEAEAHSIYPDHELVRACRSLSLDLPSMRRTVNRLGVPLERLRAIETKGLSALPDIEQDCWSAFLSGNEPIGPVELPLGGCFDGIGWFEPDLDPPSRLSARWMGGGRSASIFVRVTPGRAYKLEITAHHLRSPEMATGISIMLFGRRLPVELNLQGDGTAFITAPISQEMATVFDGRLRFSVRYDDSAGHEGWVSFSNLRLVEQGPLVRSSSRAAAVSDTLKAFYNQKYTKGQEIARTSKQYALDCVPPDGHLLILDIGCGSGANSLALAQKGHQLHGVDISDVAIEKYRRSGFKGQVADIEQGLDYPEAFFDLVFCSEVIECMISPGDLIAEINRVLKPGGLLVLSTRNSAFWLFRLLGLFGYTVGQLQHPRHFQFFSRQMLTRLFESHRLRTKRAFGRNMYAILPDLPRPFGRLLSALGLKPEIRFRTGAKFWHLSHRSSVMNTLFADTLIFVLERPR
jgi:SAM-dependent methyltransferase/MoaA/NifB/PqqE/SkfB family radical SAM enzyme